MLREWAYVPKTLLRVADVKDDLTTENGAYWSASNSGVSTEGIPRYLKMYETTKTHVLVPRNWAGLPGLESKHVEFADYRFDEEGTDIEEWWDSHCSIELRDDIQREAAEALLKDEEDKMLSLACGRGKTVVSLFCANKGKRLPVLIVVHTNALMDQWRKEVKKFYHLEDEDIGHVQGPKCDWEDKPVVVAMLHTLVKKKFPQEFYDYFRLVIYDEAHRLGAAYFAQAAPMFPGERWGLSATHRREDGNDVLFKMHLGEVAYENLEQDLKPSVYFVETGVKPDLSRYMFRGRVKYAQLLTDLSKHEGRNDLILSYLNKALDKGRTVLVLGERVQQLHDLCDACDATESKSVHVGSMKKAEREEALTKRAVFATQQLAKEGLDRPAFDTLFVLVPFGGKGRLEQSGGRILRLHASRTFVSRRNGRRIIFRTSAKKPPKIVIFVDQDYQSKWEPGKKRRKKVPGMVAALGNKMRRNLQAIGWKARTINGAK